MYIQALLSCEQPSAALGVACMSKARSLSHWLETGPVSLFFYECVCVLVCVCRKVKERGRERHRERACSGWRVLHRHAQSRTD